MQKDKLKRDFFITIDKNFGCIYYVPKKRLIRIKKENAIEIKKCIENDLEMDSYNEKILKNMIEIGEECNNFNLKDVLKNNRILKLEIVVSTYCNLNCVYCYANGGNYTEEKKIMSYETVDEIVRFLEVNKISIDKIQFFGGEPLLAYKTISYMCRELEKHDIQVNNFCMVSNFVYLPQEFIEDIIKYKIMITVSLDGPKKITNRLRSSRDKNLDVYDSVVKNINMLRNMGGDITAVECTYTDLHQKMGYSKNDIKDYLEKELSVNNIILEEDMKNENIIQIDNPKSNFHDVKRMTFDEKIFLKAAFEKKYCHSNYCLAGIKSFSIFPNGEIYPCHLFDLNRKEEFLLGNVSDVEWDKREKYIKVRDKILNCINLRQCSECNKRNFCRFCSVSIILGNEKKNENCELSDQKFTDMLNNYVESKYIIS